MKIDRSFVRDLPKDSGDQAIAQAIVNMGKARGMTVVAEGVETTKQETFLRDHASDEMQGFLFSRPIPPEQIPDLLRLPLHAAPLLQPEPRTNSVRSTPGLGPRQQVTIVSGHCRLTPEASGPHGVEAVAE
jgi:predicted signal transduction protein with EAL and GGDEF domain